MSRERVGSLRAGFSALSQRKLILLLALSAAVLGGLIAAPLVPAFHEDFAGTLAGDHLLRNHPTFAPTDYLDFYRERHFAIAGMRRTAGAVSFLGVILQAFFAGGIVAVLGRGRFSFAQFFEPARRNFWHNCKCLLLFLAAATVLLGGWLLAAFPAAKRLLEDVPPDALARRLAPWFILGIAALILAVLTLVYDFARAARRYSPTIGAWRGVRFALRVLRGNWLRALALWTVWLILGAAAVLAGFAVAWWMPAVSLPAIAILFAVQFAVLWLRAAARVATWGSFCGFLEPRARPALAPLSGFPGVRTA